VTTEIEEPLERLLAKTVPGLASLVSFDRLPQGASAETYAIAVETQQGSRKLCLRRAPGGEEQHATGARPDLVMQAQLMRLAAANDVPEPEILHVLEESDELGAGFLMSWIEGETLGSRIVRSEELAEVRPRLAFQCGEILARIHAIDFEAAGLDRRLAKSQARQEVELNWQRYKELRTPQPMIDFTGRWLLDHLPPPTEERLVHAEFRNGNFVVGPDGIRAVLDWEMAHIGDPMRDLGWLCNNSWTYGRTELPVGGFGTVEQLFAGYESVTGVPVEQERVHFWTVFGSFWWSITCLGMVEHFRSGPDSSVERAAIGRRSSEAQIDCVNLLIPGRATLPEPADLDSVLDVPRSDELLSAVRDLLRQDVMSETSGRLNFLSRVAGNALDIVLRELTLGPDARARELAGLQSLLGRDGDLTTLRWELVERLRSGARQLDPSELADYLRTTVAGQVAIDQPKYSGLRAVTEEHSLS